ncbi:fatty acid amide hydrolase-like protein isoform X1, partial [Tanacetum coccineum]
MAVLSVAILFATFYVCLGATHLAPSRLLIWFNDVFSPEISTKCEDILYLLSETHGCKVVEVVIPELHQLRMSHLLPVGSESLASLTPRCHDRNGIES